MQYLGNGLEDQRRLAGSQQEHFRRRHRQSRHVFADCEQQRRDRAKPKVQRQEISAIANEGRRNSIRKPSSVGDRRFIVRLIDPELG